MDNLKKQMANVLCILTKVADQVDLDHAGFAIGSHSSVAPQSTVLCPFDETQPATFSKGLIIDQGAKLICVFYGAVLVRLAIYIDT